MKRRRFILNVLNEKEYLQESLASLSLDRSADAGRPRFFLLACL
jgi:hypothetical protein